VIARVAAGLAAIAAAGPIHAQEPLADLAGRLAGMSAPVGYEAAMADSIAALLLGATRDRAGNVIVRPSSGAARRLVACPLDEPGWAVGGVRDDGYLTVRRLPGRIPPLFDQHLEGHRITLFGRRGPVPGVVAVRSTHLTRGRTIDETPFSSDQAFIDVGARTADEARALGIGVTTPLTAAKRPHRYGTSLLAAPVVGRRAACAALIRAARAGTRRAAMVAFVVEQGLGARGLLTAVNEAGPFDEVLLLEGGEGDGAVTASADTVRFGATSQSVTRWTLRTRFAGTPVETVDLADAAELERRIAVWLRGGR
jgi:putative aminopeptidase FrvX